MCDFKVGDEVVCVDAVSRTGVFSPLTNGAVYTVKAVLDFGGSVGIILNEVDPPTSFEDFNPDRFRKIQRRDLTEWLSSSVGNTDKIDKRKRVSA